MATHPFLAKDAGAERKGETLLQTLLDAGDKGGHRRIRCPECGWRPGREDRWQCGCGHVWNTFDTAGLCPECGYQWQITACLSCGKFSPHKAWYTGEPPVS